MDGIDQVYSLPFNSCEDIDLAVDSFTKLIQLATLEPTPLLGNRFIIKYARWWSPELPNLRRLYRHKIRINRVLKTGASKQKPIEANKLKILRAKNDYWKKLCMDKASSDPWNTIHRICKFSGGNVKPIHMTGQVRQ